MEEGAKIRENHSDRKETPEMEVIRQGEEVTTVADDHRAHQMVAQEEILMILPVRPQARMDQEGRAEETLEVVAVEVIVGGGGGGSGGGGGGVGGGGGGGSGGSGSSGGVGDTERGAV